MRTFYKLTVYDGLTESTQLVFAHDIQDAVDYYKKFHNDVVIRSERLMTTKQTDNDFYPTTITKLSELNENLRFFPIEYAKNEDAYYVIHAQYRKFFTMANGMVRAVSDDGSVKYMKGSTKVAAL